MSTETNARDEWKRDAALAALAAHEVVPPHVRHLVQEFAGQVGFLDSERPRRRWHVFDQELEAWRPMSRTAVMWRVTNVALGLPYKGDVYSELTRLAWRLSETESKDALLTAMLLRLDLSAYEAFAPLNRRGIAAAPHYVRKELLEAWLGTVVQRGDRVVRRRTDGSHVPMLRLLSGGRA
jgi:hypothetical protein